KEPVLGRQSIAGFRRNPPTLSQYLQHRHSFTPSQFGEPATGDELLRLDEKLDLSDATAAKLDVVPFDCDLTVTPVGMDLALDGVNVSDGCVVHVLAPYVRRQLLEERPSGFDVTCDGSCLDHCGTLPVLAAPFIIDQRCLDRDGER